MAQKPEARGNAPVDLHKTVLSILRGERKLPASLFWTRGENILSRRISQGDEIQQTLSVVSHGSLVSVMVRDRRLKDQVVSHYTLEKNGSLRVVVKRGNPPTVLSDESVQMFLKELEPRELQKKSPESRTR